MPTAAAAARTTTRPPTSQALAPAFFGGRGGGAVIECTSPSDGASISSRSSTTASSCIVASGFPGFRFLPMRGQHSIGRMETRLRRARFVALYYGVVLADAARVVGAEDLARVGQTYLARITEEGA